jgi:hypothetical protein
MKPIPKVTCQTPEQIAECRQFLLAANATTQTSLVLGPAEEIERAAAEYFDLQVCSMLFHQRISAAGVAAWLGPHKDSECNDF